MAVVDSHFITAVHQMELSGLVNEVIQFMCPAVVDEDYSIQCHTFLLMSFYNHIKKSKKELQLLCTVHRDRL